MAEETKSIHLFCPIGNVEKYIPVYDSNRSIPHELTEVDYEYGRFANVENNRLVFYCDKIVTDADERFLRGNDVLVADGPSKFIFVKDRIMNCLKHLIGKDIQIIPAEIYTKNGPVEGYHLINIINTVHGIDKDKTIYGKFKKKGKYIKELFIKNENFMEGYEIACDEEFRDNIYVASTLRDKLVKSKIGMLRGLKFITTKRNEEAKHIYLFEALGGVEKYSPLYDEDRSIPSSSYFDVGYGRGEAVDMKGKRLIFKCTRVGTDAEEKRLRSHDLLWAGPGKFIFVNDRIMDCLKHLVDRDIQFLPAEIYTQNGLVEGYHLVNVINTVHGVDQNKSDYWIYEDGSKSLDKLVPKNEDFMGGHEIACEDEMEGHIYIIPELREKLLKSKNGKLKGLEISTAKEVWEAGHTDPY